MAIDWSAIGHVTGIDREAVARKLVNMIGQANSQAAVDQALALLRDNGLTDEAASMEAMRFKYHPKTLIGSASFSVLAPVEPDPILDNDQYGW